LHRAICVCGSGGERSIERESVRVRVRGPIIDGWAVRGPCKTRTDQILHHWCMHQKNNLPLDERYGHDMAPL
jgi:hypothetical protein